MEVETGMEEATGVTEEVTVVTVAVDIPNGAEVDTLEEADTTAEIGEVNSRMRQPAFHQTSGKAIALRSPSLWS